MEDSPEDQHHRRLLKQWCKENGSNTASILEKLNEPLLDGVWRYDEKNILCTHHLLSKGNFHILDDKMDSFLEFYADNLCGNNLGVCEAVHGQDHKFFMDLDYRKLSSALTEDDIINHAKEIVKIVSEYDERKRIEDDVLKAAVFFNESKFVDGYWKVGCHIVFQSIITNRQYSFGLNQFISKRMKDVFGEFDWDSIIEKKLEDLRMPYSGKVKVNSFYRFLSLINENGECFQEEDMKKIIKLASIRALKGVILKRGYLCRIPRSSVPYDSWGDQLLQFIDKNLTPLPKNPKYVNVEEVVSGRKWTHIKIEIGDADAQEENPFSLICEVSVGGSIRIKDNEKDKVPRLKIPEEIASLMFDPSLKNPIKA